MDLKVFIATHKPYDLPVDDMYQPLHVGAARATAALPYTSDDSGDNISALNGTYCELSGLYWVRKNTHHDAYGLVHYRRYFAGHSGAPATGREMASMLSDVDVVVPRRRHYVVQNVAQHYGSAHHARDLDVVRRVLLARDPNAVPSFDKVMRARSLVLYNMLLMRQGPFFEYCDWLFPILESARVDISLESYGPQQTRVMGYLGERLLNVWLHKESHLRVRHQAVAELERQSVFGKGTRMVGRMIGIGRAE